MGDEFYEYPNDHVGRRTYVTVRGHDRLVPKYKTYKGQDGYYWLSPEWGGTFGGYGNVSAYILPDKQPYVSPLDGTLITSRSHHREHMRKHDVIEAGDMEIGCFNGYNRDEHGPVSGRDIADAIRELGGD